MDFRHHIELEGKLSRRLQIAWQKYSDPIYSQIAKLCSQGEWDKARLLVPELDMTEVGTANREWIKYLLLSIALHGATSVTDRKPLITGMGAFDHTLNQVVSNILQYLEHGATAQVQQQALQLIALDQQLSGKGK